MKLVTRWVLWFGTAAVIALTAACSGTPETAGEDTSGDRQAIPSDRTVTPEAAGEGSARQAMVAGGITWTTYSCGGGNYGPINGSLPACTPTNSGCVYSGGTASGNTYTTTCQCSGYICSYLTPRLTTPVSQ